MRLRSAVALAAAAAGVAAVATAERRWRAADADDPCGPDPLRLPDGEERKVSTDDGATLAVTVAGPDDGPAVVLVHGWTNARGVWAPVARRLVESGHRVVLYDQRGHGSSTLGDAGFGLDRLGLDLAAVLRSLDVHDAVIAGHSMGGMTIQALAAEDPALLAERAARIVLSSTGAQIFGRRAARAMLRADQRAARAVLRENRGDSATGGRAELISARFAFGRSPRYAHLCATRDMLVACDPEVRRGYLAAMGEMDLRGGLADISTPTTIVVGRFDALTPLPLSRRLASAIGGAELVVLPRAGHMLPLERPGELAELIAARAADDQA